VPPSRLRRRIADDEGDMLLRVSRDEGAHEHKPRDGNELRNAQLPLQEKPGAAAAEMKEV
jgi:hypothetical protein